MAKIFRISFYIVGAIIGAGFASGKEIIVFFKEGGLNYLSVFYVALLIFAFCLVFLSVGSKINSSSIVKVNQALGGKLSNLFNLLTVFNCVIVLSAMLGGVNEIGSQIFKSGVVCSVAIALLSGVMVYSGRKSIQVGGGLMVLVIVVSILWICLNSPKTTNFFDVSAFYPISLTLYVAMNAFLATGILTTENGLNNKQIFAVSGIVAVIVGALISFLCVVMGGVENEEMPILLLAKNLGRLPYVFAIILLVLSIFTTILACAEQVVCFFETITGSRFVALAITYGVSFSLSLLGFSKVVAFLYPLIGGVGIFYFLFCLKYLVSPTLNQFFYKRNSKIHQPRKQAKNNG